jgi:formiminotetrahydrofolate cyclodeaminase
MGVKKTPELRELMLEIAKFLNQIASDTPTPGGGSASALAGALSASLCAMVAGLSLNRGKLKKHEAGNIRNKCQLIQRRLYKAIEEDAESYMGVMRAFRLPKTTESDILYRSQVIQRALKKATMVPQAVCEHSLTLLEFSKILLLRGNPNAWSDAGVAAYLANGALDGAVLNIRINLESIRDKSFRKKMSGLIQRVLRERNRLMTQITRALGR